MTTNDVEYKLVTFIENNKNQLEKPTYYSINSKYEKINKDPSYIVELYYLYLKNCSDKNKCENILNAIENEKKYVFIDKNKRIDRLSKYSIEKLEDSFKRSIFNKDKIHSVKLGNELIIRNKCKFFDIMYNFSLISADTNKLVKTYFLEKMYDICSTRDSKEALLKNVINYFVKSENIIVNWENKSDRDFYIKNIDNLYKYVYNKIKEKKYFIQMKYIDEVIDNVLINNNIISESKQILLEYITK